MKATSIQKMLKEEASKHELNEDEAYKAMRFTRDFLGSRLAFMEKYGAAEGAVEDMKTAYSTVSMLIKFYEKERK